MKHRFFLLCLLFNLAVIAQKREGSALLKSNEMCWWYEKSVARYRQGLPVATGRFAAMIGGKISEEDIVFHDEILWSGSPYNPNNAGGPEILAATREYVPEQDYGKPTAEALKLKSTPVSVQHYQPMGILTISFPGHGEKEAKADKRKLSMDSALVRDS